MFRLIGRLIQSAKDNNDNATNAPYSTAKNTQSLNSHNVVLPYQQQPSLQPVVVAQPRQTCCSRKRERRIERQLRREEKRQLRSDQRQLRAERQTERQAERLARRGGGGCCGGGNRRQEQSEATYNLPQTMAVASPQYQTLPAQQATRTATGTGMGYQAGVGREQQQQQFEIAAAGVGVGGSSGWGPEVAHDVPPPSYEEVQRVQKGRGKGW